MTDPASITDAIDETAERLAPHVPGGVLAPEDWAAVYAEVAEVLGVSVEEVLEAQGDRLAMAGSG